MQLYIKNKLLSLKGSSVVLDENDKTIYKVKGKFFSITKKKFIKDENNNTIYMIRNKYWDWPTHSAFVFDSNKTRVAEVKTRYLLRTNSFNILGYEDELRIEGDIVGWNYKIYKGEEFLGSIERKLFRLTDTFVLEIEKEENAPLFVALVIAIDNISDRREKENKKS